MTGHQTYEALQREVLALRTLRSKLLRILEESEEELHAPHVSARWLMEQRQNRGWSRQDIAAFMRVSFSCVRSWESARTNLSRRRRQQLVALFDQHPTKESKNADGSSGRCQCDLCSKCARTWRFRLGHWPAPSSSPAPDNIMDNDALPPTS